MRINEHSVLLFSHTIHMHDFLHLTFIEILPVYRLLYDDNVFPYLPVVIITFRVIQVLENKKMKSLLYVTCRYWN